MPFVFRNKDRIEMLIGELKEYRYRNLHDIDEFLWYSDDGSAGNQVPQGDPEPIHLGFRWKGYDRYNWICTKIHIPTDWKEEDVVGLFDFGVPTGTGNNSHFESLLYLNGQAYQGVDGNHQEVFLDVAKNGFDLDLNFRVWSGLNGGGKPKEMAMELVRAQYGILDHSTDDLYYLAKNAWEAYGLLDSKNEYKEWILNELVEAFRRIDYTEPGSERFYESIKEAYDFLNQTMDGRGKPDVSVSMIGHTHIDVAWLWRLRHTREKAARSFSTVNRLMDQYEDYEFLQSQPQLYEYIKKDYPNIYEQIKARVAEGKWEPAGGMWVECDCNIASGESIVRQILLGKNFYRKEFGYESEFLWLPDVFGYSWAMPQILKKSGINTFMTTKISWNDTNKMPYDTFTWVGMDGSEVLTHFVTTKDDWEGATSYTYNGDTRPYAVKGAWDNYSNKDLNRNLLISYGYGDGGGGPTREMIKNIECLNKIPGIPKVKNEHATTYFRRLHETLDENKMHGYRPVWDGELYLEFHRGTYTSQAYNKKMNRRMEEAMRNVEFLSVLAETYAGIPYDKETLLEAWKIILTHQFHDILPGSSIHEVYEDSRVNYAKVRELLDKVEKKVNAGIMEDKDNTYTIWNNSNWKRSSYVTIDHVTENDQFVDKNGTVLKSVTENQTALVYLPDMEPLSFETIYRQDRKEKTIPQCLESHPFETPFYRVCFNEAGQLTRLYDKTAGREVMEEGKRGNVLQMFEDKPSCFDAWELESTIDLKREEIMDCQEFSLEKNELGVFVTLGWIYHNSSVHQVICFYEDKKRIDFKTTVDWREHQKLLKVAFPVNVRATSARYDIQYGNIERPITRNNSWEAARFEVVAHKWADLHETGYGVALMNDCKYGYDIKENTMRLSLLKSAIYPDYDADQGIQTFTYALYPHTEEWYDAGIEQEAFDLNQHLTGIAGMVKINQSGSFTFSQDHVCLDAVKKAEISDTIIVRFHEFEGRRGTIRLNTALPVDQFWECNLMEEAIQQPQTGVMEFEIKPYEIKTIALRRK